MNLYQKIFPTKKSQLSGFTKHLTKKLYLFYVSFSKNIYLDTCFYNHLLEKNLYELFISLNLANELLHFDTQALNLIELLMILFRLKVLLNKEKYPIPMLIKKNCS